MLRIITSIDHGAESPLEWTDTRLVSFNRRHNNFCAPSTIMEDDHGNLPIGLRRQLDTGTAFILGYSEHGACTWYLSDGKRDWDSCPVAGVLWLPDDVKKEFKTYNDRKAWARNTLEYYTAWCNGYVYCLEIEGNDDYTTGDCYLFDVEKDAREILSVPETEEIEVVFRYD